MWRGSKAASLHQAGGGGESSSMGGGARIVCYYWRLWSSKMWSRARADTIWKAGISPTQCKMRSSVTLVERYIEDQEHTF
jgi:hypothetical protein